MIISATLPSPAVPSAPPLRWLRRYYTVRALFSVAWVASAFTVGKQHPPVGLALLIAYPAWDCLANYVDARCTGGLRANPSQMWNAIVSAMVTLAIVITAGRDLHRAFGAVGVWAALSGLLQLATGVRRWRSATAQWPQILSGAQSSLAALHFIMKATTRSSILTVADVAPYAAFGAFYFAISAGVLALRRSSLPATRHDGVRGAR